MKDSFLNRRTWGPCSNIKYPNVLKYPGYDDLEFPIVIAGPCSIENPKQVENIAKRLSKENITFMRGGVTRAGTYPPNDLGFSLQKLLYFKKIANDYGLKIINEVIDVGRLWEMYDFTDAFQIGTRHMQDYFLLDKLSRQDKPVFLKRGFGNNLDEFLGAAEYLASGICPIVLIERGSSSFMNHVRHELSVSTIALIKKLTRIPIIVDASHGSGRHDLVIDLLKSGIAAGADGYLIEVHPKPRKSLTDADQAFPLDKFSKLNQEIHELFKLIRNKDFKRRNLT